MPEDRLSPRPRPRLLAVGEAFGATGYGRVMESVMPRLGRTFEVVVFAVDLHEERSGDGARACAGAGAGFEVRPNALPGDNYGVDQLPGLLDELDPDVVLLHRDSTFFPMHREALAAFRARRPDARVVAYCPLDFGRVPPPLAEADLLALYTRTARDAAASAFASAELAAPPMALVAHGVDRERFAPLVPGDLRASRIEARRRLFPPGEGLERAFVVLNANRNQRRKRIDLTLRGFALFARDRPDARLYLHMGMSDLGCDVLALAAELEVADRLLLTTRDTARPHVPDSELNLIYNACDVGINTAVAEGWGLASFEHAATGAAQVVPDHGACRELWRDRALLLETTAGEGAQQVVDEDGVADALGRLHDEPELLADLAQRAWTYATSDRFAWETITREWEALLLGLLAPDPAAAKVDRSGSWPR